jgi:hypothetical protein
MFGKRKDPAIVAIELFGKRDQSEEQVSPLVAIAEELINAIKARDPEAVAEALQAAYYECAEEKPEDESEEE